MSTNQVLAGIGLILVLAVGSQVLASRLRIPTLILLLRPGPCPATARWPVEVSGREPGHRLPAAHDQLRHANRDLANRLG